MLGYAIKLAALLCIAAVAAVTHLSRHGPEPAATAQAARSVPAPPPPTTRALGYGRVELRPDRAGHYTADVEIGGRTLAMLVDTGASVVALRYEDARKLGLTPAEVDFKIPLSTANGILRAAELRLPEVRVGTIRATDVRAMILPRGATEKSLLGMSFLQKLGGFEVASGNLILKP